MIALPLRPRHRQEPGIAAAGRLAHRGTPYGTSLSFATTTHLWPLPDPPSRKSRSATSRTGTARSIPGRALASSVPGSPCQGPGTGLPPPISTSVPGTPDSDGTYGARRVHAELRLEHGVRVGRKRVERLMRVAGISGLLPRKRRRTTVRLPGVRVAPDLVERDFDPTGPNQTWSADITYISTWEGFLYLAHVQDLYSRRIVGWSMADHL
ncbi:MAG TPA: IS3 family transposase, partial [Dermatophilaceae bacterium]